MSEEKPIEIKSGEELLARLAEGENTFEGVMVINTMHLQELLGTPYIFVAAVDPSNGKIQVSSNSTRPDVAKLMAETFSKAWREAVEPLMMGEPSRIVKPDGMPFHIVPKADIPPASTSPRRRRPPRRRKEDDLD